MNFKSVIILVISFSVAAFCSFFPSLTFQALAEPSGQIDCKRTGTVAVTCCQDHIINRSPANPAGTLVTYCTDCNIYYDTAGDWHVRDCGERYIAVAAEEPINVPPSVLKRLQGIFGEATTLPEVSVLEGQRANISILPGGILQSENNLTFTQANISSNEGSGGLLGIEQSNSVSDEGENGTKSVNDEEQDEGEETEEEQDESSSSKVQSREAADVAEDDDKENID